MSTAAEARAAARDRHDFDTLIDRVPYARFLGIDLSLHDGVLRSRLPYRPSLIGNSRLPAVHGGVTAAFMENAAVMQLLLQIDQDRIPKSIDFSIDYLLPNRPEDAFAECSVSRAGLRVAQTMIRCWQSTPDRPIAIARAHFLLSAAE